MHWPADLGGGRVLPGASVPTNPQSVWTTTNLAEAYPGVLSPLDWSVVGPMTEQATRAALRTMGVLTADEAATTDPDEMAFACFYGRVASRIQFFHRLGGLMPGTSPEAVLEQFFGFVPEGLNAEQTWRRYPAIVARMPVALATGPRRARAGRAETRGWWAAEIAAMPTRSHAEAVTALAGARRQLLRVFSDDALVLLTGIQPVHDQLTALVAQTGVDPAQLMSGYGSHEETELIVDIWRCAQGEVDLAYLTRRYGYHGPREGVLSGVVWREDARPLEELIEGFRRRADIDPREAAEQRKQARLAAERELLVRLPRTQRAKARVLFALAVRYTPLRGKAARTQALDVIRAATRRLGACLAEDGVLAAADDVMFLSVQELTGALPADVQSAVSERRAAYERCQQLQLPDNWTGEPQPREAHAPDVARAAGVEVLQGIGVSAGEARGRACVLEDSSDDMEDGAILFAHTTDPSWTPAMYLSSALVVDIGGAMSHAAIVARELGVPCVMGTQDGTARVRTGDLCEVNGTSGEVRVTQGAS